MYRPNGDECYRAATVRERTLSAQFVGGEIRASRKPPGETAQCRKVFPGFDCSAVGTNHDSRQRGQGRACRTRSAETGDRHRKPAKCAGIQCLSPKFVSGEPVSRKRRRQSIHENDAALGGFACHFRSVSVAVGMAVTGHPPHRPVLAGTTAYGSYLGCDPFRNLASKRASGYACTT